MSRTYTALRMCVSQEAMYVDGVLIRGLFDRSGASPCQHVGARSRLKNWAQVRSPAHTVDRNRGVTHDNFVLPEVRFYLRTTGKLKGFQLIDIKQP